MAKFLWTCLVITSHKVVRNYKISGYYFFEKLNINTLSNQVQYDDGFSTYFQVIFQDNVIFTSMSLHLFSKCILSFMKREYLLQLHP